MTRWKWDADPGDPLNEHRIPVTSDMPLYSYIACFHKDSPHRPTDREIRQIRSFIEEHTRTWLTPRDREQNDRQPFDLELGRNPVIFIKYATNDWGYRRKTWPVNRFAPPSPRVPTRVSGPKNLVEIMDLLHNTSDSLLNRWHRWKVEHPDVFGPGESAP